MMTEVKAKVCRGCRKELSVSEYYFDQRREAPMARCKACSKKWLQGYRKTVKGKATHIKASTKWQKANPKKYALKRRSHYDKHHDSILKTQRNRWKDDKNGYRTKTRFAHRLKKSYGLSIEEYTRLLVAQKNVCAICAKSNINNKCLTVDHCHRTGKVRGLLCGKCNCALGYMDDTPKRLTSAAEYLIRFGK